MNITYRSINRFLCIGLLLLLAAATGSGCNKGGLSGLVPCAGTIRLDGKPLNGAQLTLVPSEGFETGKRGASAVSNPEGRFVFSTLKENDGVYPATYKVNVTKFEETGKVIQLPERSSETGEHLTINESVNRLPEKYSRVGTTDLQLVVPPGGDKNVVLELSSR